MSQVSGAAREASMDEILASIRRIIEESDAAAAAVEANGARQKSSGRPRKTELSPQFDQVENAAVEDRRLSDEDEIDRDVIAAGEAELQAFREAVRDNDSAAPVAQKESADTAASPEPVSGSDRPLSLADIQARLSRETASNQEHEASPVEADTVNAAGSIALEADHATDEISEWPGEPDTDADPMIDDDVDNDDWPIRSAPFEKSFREVAGRLDRGPSRERTTAENSGRAQVQEPVPETVEASANSGLASLVEETLRAEVSPGGRSQNSLLSQDTGRAVADSFGQLKEAFFASRQRNFDEMAEDLLRPMLREWLDDNLPTLVERLVKEEIERIAQSG